jgi:putative colanic acid biosynthesis acetyltransferase WcaF
MKTDLFAYTNNTYNPGSKLKIGLWYVVNAVCFANYFMPISAIKVILLRAFGAKIGKGVVIKPNVTIKYPWLLEIGDHVWIGEQVWIDNLAKVTIGDHVCISQGALLLCGNHNYKKPSFDLLVGKISIEEGAWIGAKAVVCPDVIVHSHAILSVGSVATKNLEPYSIYQGNPAIKIRDRIIEAN